MTRNDSTQMLPKGVVMLRIENGAPSANSFRSHWLKKLAPERPASRDSSVSGFTDRRWFRDYSLKTTCTKCSEAQPDCGAFLSKMGFQVHNGRDARPDVHSFFALRHVMFVQRNELETQRHRRRGCIIRTHSAPRSPEPCAICYK
jgi:hypothetical protein